MKRRRHRLKVDTFPFLAVLLCAMGALVLVLIAMDQRAKIVARNKALAAAKQKAEQRDQLARQEQVEFEKKRNSLRARLESQKRQLDAKVASIQTEAETTTQAIGEARIRLTSLKDETDKKRAQIKQREQSIFHRRKKLKNEKKNENLIRQTIARLSEELLKLENVVRHLHTSKKRAGKAYSLVPYYGKRGAKRQPIYIECDAHKLVFHPEGRFLSQSELQRETIRSTVKRHLGKLKGDVKPYILFLVRPAGIGLYYRAQTAIRELDVKFGYEFIDQDWILTFPPSDALAGGIQKSDEPKGPLAGLGTKGNGPALGPPQHDKPGRGTSLSPRGSGVFPGANPNVPGTGDNAHARLDGFMRRGNLSGRPQSFPREGSRADGRSNGADGSGGNSPAVLGPLQFGDGVGDEQIDARSRLGTPGDGKKPSTGIPGDKGEERAGGGSDDKGKQGGIQATGKPGKKSRGSGRDGERKRGELGGPGKASTRDRRVEGKKSQFNMPPLSGDYKANDQKSQHQKPKSNKRPPKTKQKGPRVVSDTPPPPNPTENAAAGIAAGSKSQRKERPPLSRFIGNRDYTIIVECTADGVILKPWGKKYALETLRGRRDANHPLVKDVRRRIARRQATVVDGQLPYRPEIRFHVRPEGLRSYYFSYPLFEGLGIPMARFNIRQD